MGADVVVVAGGLFVGERVVEVGGRGVGGEVEVEVQEWAVSMDDTVRYKRLGLRCDEVR